MKYHILAFGAGFLLDQIFGDPYFLPHPIRGIGWLIAKTERVLRSGNPQGNSPEREAAEIMKRMGEAGLEAGMIGEVVDRREWTLEIW